MDLPGYGQNPADSSPMSGRSPIAVKLDNLIRSKLRVSNPYDPTEIADGLTRFYRGAAEHKRLEEAGLPFYQVQAVPPPQPVTAGDVLYLDNDEWHTFRTLLNSDLQFLEIYLPGRFKTVWADSRPTAFWSENLENLKRDSKSRILNARFQRRLSKIAQRANAIGTPGLHWSRLGDRGGSLKAANLSRNWMSSQKTRKPSNFACIDPHNIAEVEPDRGILKVESASQLLQGNGRSSVIPS